MFEDKEEFMGLEFVYDVDIPEPPKELVNNILRECTKYIEASVLETEDSKSSRASRRYWATENIVNEIIDGLSTYINERISYAPERLMYIPPHDIFSEHIANLVCDWGERNQSYFHENKAGTTENLRTSSAIRYMRAEISHAIIQETRKRYPIPVE